MRRAMWLLLPIVIVGAVSAVIVLGSRSTSAKPDAVEALTAATLPIQKVVLFSSGVGYFERRGQVDGSARIDLTFQARDINDLIKSMVLHDDKGIVSAVSYDSLDPVERTLKSYAVNLTGNPTFGGILMQMRGEKVEVVLQQSAVNQPGTVQGAIMSIEKQRLAAKDGATEQEILSLWCAEGVRTVRLSDVQRLRFLNPTIENEFRRALDTLALAHDAQKKAVALHFTGDGKRDVKVGYVIENPIWKTSYRLVLDKESGKPFLQGWAVVDNSTDDDWNHVGMALISGRPISFQMDLYQPLYVPRPMVEMELFQSLRPVAYGGAVGDARVLNELSQKRLAPMKKQSGAVMDPDADAENWGKLPERNRAANGVEFERARQLATELSRRMDLGKGVQSAATAAQLGDFFQYIINQPVNLPRQKSALLPIVNKEIEGKRLSVYNPAVHAKFPMLGLLLKNSSGLHLLQGPITVFEGSTYAGDARIQDLQPNDERLISFAVDLGTEVETKAQRPPERLTAIRIERGLIVTTNRIREELTYTATNRSGQERTLWIEHPYRAEFELVSKQEAVERTAEFRRFELKLPAGTGKSVAMTIVEERDLNTAVAISNSADDALRFFVNHTLASPNLKKALGAALELKATLAKIRQDLSNVNLELQNITQDQSRLRQNLREMPATAAAYKRYLEKFDKQETQIEELQTRQKELQTQELSARQAVDKYLADLNVK